MLDPPPPNRLAIPAMSPPSPAMLLSPLLSGLDAPPETVCFTRLPQTLPDCEAVVLVLEGDPNLRSVGTVFALNDEVRVSGELGAFAAFSLSGCEEVSRLDGVKNFSMLSPFIFGLGSRPNLPDKLLLRFATFILHSPRLL